MGSGRRERSRYEDPEGGRLPAGRAIAGAPGTCPPRATCAACGRKWFTSRRAAGASGVPSIARIAGRRKTSGTVRVAPRAYRVATARRRAPRIAPVSASADMIAEENRLIRFGFGLTAADRSEIAFVSTPEIAVQSELGLEGLVVPDASWASRAACFKSCCCHSGRAGIAAIASPRVGISRSRQPARALSQKI
jgi:hypothetical protein